MGMFCCHNGRERPPAFRVSRCDPARFRKCLVCRQFRPVDPAMPRFDPARDSASVSINRGFAHFGTSRPRRTALALGQSTTPGRPRGLGGAPLRGAPGLREGAGCHHLGELASPPCVVRLYVPIRAKVADHRRISPGAVRGPDPLALGREP
jgi:hypothetical protein